MPGRTRPGLGWTELVVGIVAYLGLAVVLTLAILAVVGGRPSMVVVVGVSALAALGAAAIALAVRVRSLAAVGLRRASATWLLLGVAGGVVGWLVNRGVILAYLAISGDTSNPQQGLADSAAGSTGELLGLLAVGAVLVPIGEELLFRGIGFGSLRRYGIVVATIASSLLFGIAHGVNVVLPAAIVLGVINALLYERSRSIWPSVVAHSVNNAIVFVSAAIILG